MEKKHYGAIDGLRMIAAFGIVMMHMRANNNYEISGWFELVAKVCEILYSIDSDKLKEIVVQNKIHKSTSKHNIGIKDPILSYKKEFLISSLQIKDTGIYVETSLSSNRARYYTKQILDLFELTDEFQLYVY